MEHRSSTSNRDNLFETLQREFCPPLDSSLLAALLAELDLELDDPSSTTPQPSRASVDELRLTLSQLAAAADEESTLCGDFDALQTACPTTEDTYSTVEIESLDFSLASSSSSNSPSSSARSTSSGSGSQQLPFETPLGFLKAALPHIPTSRLKRTLEDAGVEDLDTIDMEAIVTSILTDEYIRELEERGIDVSEDEDASSVLWETVKPKKNHRKAAKAATRKQAQKRTIVLGDILQRNQRPPPTTPDPTMLAPDPWVQVTSLSDHLSNLLPPYPAQYFQSAFHSGKHSSRYDALRSSLTSICITSQKSPKPGNVDNVLLFGLLDVLLPTSNPSSGEYRDLVSDAQLALAATEGRTDDALDLVAVLRDLAEDRPDSVSFASAIASPFNSPPVSPVLAHTARLPSAPPTPILPPSHMRQPTSLPTSPLSSPILREAAWQTIPQRAPRNLPHTHAEFIPAYKRPGNGMKPKGTGNGVGQGGKGDVGELNSIQSHKRRIARDMKKSNELLKEASKMWQRGNAKTRGGEVALYFAERAREIREAARKESLDAAKAVVESKRLSTRNQDIIDLHGVTVGEATVIVKDMVAANPPSALKPLKIITGRGSHSVNQVGVLKPAVKKALQADGWAVHTWDGGLIVRGKA